MKRKLILTSLLLLAVVAGLLLWQQPAPFNEACLQSDHDVVICAASNMARFSKNDPVVLEHADFDLRVPVATVAPNTTGSLDTKTATTPSIKLSAARNESIGFQIVFQTTTTNTPENVNVLIGDWHQQADSSVKKANISSRLYQAHYHLVENGAYTWGPKSDVRDWPAEYPDALVPQNHGCLGDTTLVFDSVSLPRGKNENQAVWIDSYIPETTKPGEYTTQLSINILDQVIDLNVDLTVFDVVLPDKTNIDAIGEVYRSYGLEGVGKTRDTQAWKKMAQCYQQLAHQHRMIFMERTPDLPDELGWQHYLETYQTIFDGSLFSDKFGYEGTGSNTPVSLWRVPWPQEFNVKLEAPLTSDDFTRYTQMSKQWKALVKQNGWDGTDYFAYVFDEVDGPDKNDTPKQERYEYIRMVHEQMDLLQKAIDAGTEDKSLDLLWTSHSNPAVWASDPELDLSDKVRLWSPNASAADPSFLSERVLAGDTTWFYHSGHPAVGAHSINASGIDMRTWGVIAARYDIQGTFMWAVNLGSDERPFAEPSYKPDDDRFGNGVMVYPGNQMDKIGFKKVPGPIPSMRLKSWRRGLQDAELFYLARGKNELAANTLIQSIIPVALADATGKASWPTEPAAWIEFKKELLSIASE